MAADINLKFGVIRNLHIKIINLKDSMSSDQILYNFVSTDSSSNINSRRAGIIVYAPSQ